MVLDRSNTPLYDKIFTQDTYCLGTDDYITFKNIVIPLPFMKWLNILNVGLVYVMDEGLAYNGTWPSAAY